MSTPTITPSVQDNIQQPTPQSSNSPLNMVSPDGSDARQVPAEQVDAAKSAGWQPAVKMYDSGDKTNLRWVPVSQIQEAHSKGWYPVLSQAQQQAFQKDAIQDDPVGNALVTAGGSGLLKAGEAVASPAIDAGLDAVEEGATAGKDLARQGVNKGLEFAEDKAANMNEMLQKFGENYPELSKLASSGELVYGPVNWSLTGAGPINITTLIPAANSVRYSGAVLLAPTGDQTITSGLLTVPALTAVGALVGASLNVPGVADTGALTTGTLAVTGTASIGDATITGELTVAEITSQNINNTISPNCVGDLRTASGAVISSASRNLTVSGATFTSADVGKSIYVQGAGSAGGSVVSTIAAFTDATHVILANSASTTISSGSVAYGTDCTSAIQTAFNAANSNGNALHIPAGNYLTHGLNFTGTSIKIYGDAYAATNIYCINVTDPGAINSTGSKTVGIDISGSGYNQLSNLAVFGGMSFLSDLAPFVVLLGGRSGSSGNSFAIGHIIENCFWLNYGGSYTVALYGYEQCDFINNHFESSTTTSGLLYLSANNTPGFISPYTNLVAATTSMTKVGVSGARTVFSATAGKLVVFDQGSTESCYAIKIRDAFVSCGNNSTFLSDTGSGALRNVVLDAVYGEPGATSTSMVSVTAPAWNWRIVNCQWYDASGFDSSPFIFANGFLDGEMIVDYTGQSAGHSNKGLSASSAQGSVLHMGQQQPSTSTTDHLMFSGVGHAADVNIGTLSMSGLLDTYNGQTLTFGGVPTLIFVTGITAQTAAISNQQLIASLPSNGLYRVSYYAKVTRAATSSSTLGGSTGFAISSEDNFDATANVTVSASGGTSTGNSLTTGVSGTAMISARSGSALKFSFGYTSSGATTMQYYIVVYVECLCNGQ